MIQQQNERLVGNQLRKQLLLYIYDNNITLSLVMTCALESRLNRQSSNDFSPESLGTAIIPMTQA